MFDFQFGERVKLRRVAKGWSLDNLATEMGGLVSRQMLHKYEQGTAKPSPSVLIQLAKTLGVPTSHLTQSAPSHVKFVAYRKSSGLKKAQTERLEAQIEIEVQDRVRLQNLLGQEFHLPQLSPVASVEEAEEAARELREQWRLGVDAICSLSTVLEDHGFHVVEVEAPEEFNGLSALVQDGESATVAAAVITRRQLPCDRWRFTGAHELGHNVLKFTSESRAIDQEAAAFRFGAAFLAPRELVENEVGAKRNSVSLAELLELKPRWGMSMGAIAYRLKDLGIISKETSDALWEQIIARGWRKVEPNPLDPEKPSWFKRSTLRALSEGLISRDEAQRLLGAEWDESLAPPLSQQSKRIRALRRLPREERRRIMAQRSLEAGDQFSDDAEFHKWQRVFDPIELAADLTSSRKEPAK